MRLFPELVLAAFCAGVAASAWLVSWTTSPLPLLLMALTAFASAVVMRAARLPVGPVLLAAALLLGFWRAEAAADTAMPIVPVGGDVAATLLVDDAPEPVSAGRVRFRASVVPGPAHRTDNVPHGTKLLVYVLPPDELVNRRPPPYIQYGDTLRLTGRLERPEPIGEFDYAAYLESQQIPAVLWARRAEVVASGGGSKPLAVLHRVRSALSEGLRRGIPAPQSGLAQALLLGFRGELPQSIRDDFRTSGMSHLLAISGLHVGVVMALALAATHAVYGRGHPVSVIAVASIIWVYALLSGWDPPVVRAAIMGSLVLGQTLLGRGVRGITALLLSGALMLAVDPTLLGSLSFLLSFAAMSGVILSLPMISMLSALATAPLASRDAWPARWSQYGITLLIGSAVVSLMTTLATMPLVAMHFGAVPLMSGPATMLAMPALPAALVSAALTAAVGLFSPTLASIFGVLAWAPLSWLMEVAALIPPALLSAQWLTGPWAVGWYAALGLLVWLVSSRRIRRAIAAVRRHRRWRPSGVASALAVFGPVTAIAVVLLAGQLAATAPDGRLHVYALDVGQGDAILVVTPNGRQMLVDGGPDSEMTLAALGPLLPATDRSLDVVAATHLDSDHIGGLLGVLHRYRSDVVLQGVVSEGSALHPQWQAALEHRNHQAITLQPGHRVALGDTVSLDVLSVPPHAMAAGVRPTVNNASLVLRLTHGQVSFLLTGDIEADAERHLVAAYGDALRSNVLKVGHHGSLTSTSPAFLRAVDPQSAVISAGRDNRFGHPHSDVVDRLQSAVGQGHLFSTARDGTVEYITDGDTLWVKTANTPPQ